MASRRQIEKLVRNSPDQAADLIQRLQQQVDALAARVGALEGGNDEDHGVSAGATPQLSEDRPSAHDFRLRTANSLIVDLPPWATNRVAWRHQFNGLIVLDTQAQRVALIHASQALEHLDNLRTNQVWKEAGFTLGERVTYVRYEDREDDTVEIREERLDPSFHLQPHEVERLLQLLAKNEEELAVQARKDDEARKQALIACYRIAAQRGRELRMAGAAAAPQMSDDNSTEPPQQ